MVDDGSEDNTEEIVEEFQGKDRRVRYMKHNENKGGAAARNTGVRNSRSDYVAFLDSDNGALSEWLEKSVEKIPELPDSWGILYPNMLIHSDETGVIYSKIKKPIEGYIYENLFQRNRGKRGLTIGTSGAMVKKRAFIEVGGFDEDLYGFHDYDLWYRFAKTRTFHFLNKPLILIHEHQSERLMKGDEALGKARLARKFFLKNYSYSAVRRKLIPLFKNL